MRFVLVHHQRKLPRVVKERVEAKQWNACCTRINSSHKKKKKRVYPFASAIDTKLPTPEIRHHIMLEFKKPWVQVPEASDKDHHFQGYPNIGIQDFHEKYHLIAPLSDEEKEKVSKN